MANLPHSQRTGKLWADRAPAPKPRCSLWQQLRLSLTPQPVAVPAVPMRAHLPLRSAVLCNPKLPPSWQRASEEQ